MVEMTAFINETDFELFNDEFYSKYLDKDNMTDKWFLMGSWTPITVIISLYLLIVLKLGPWLMKDRQPYNIKNFMRLYNIVQVVYNAACLYVFLKPRRALSFPVWYLVKNSCSHPLSIDEIDESSKYMILAISWYFLGLKLLDLLDTVFMVLRKKYSHITFLHVYHHAGTVFLVWFSMKYIKAIQGVFPVFLNLIVHFIMYSYYFLSTFDSFKKYLWWKRHVTKLQLLQMFLVLGYLSVLFYNQCYISRNFAYIWLFNVAVNTILFGNFYVKSYILNPRSSVEVKKKIN